MSRNLMPEIAKLLGVEIGEELMIEEVEGMKYRFSNEDFLCMPPRSGWISSGGDILKYLLIGKRKIIKLPIES